MALGGPEVLIVLIVFVTSIGALVLGIFTVVDAVRYPEWAFQRAGASRTTWIVLPIVFMLFCGLGAIIMGLVWLTSKRQQLDAAMISAGYPSPHSRQPPWDRPPGAPGGPPQYPGPPPPYEPPPYEPPPPAQ